MLLDAERWPEWSTVTGAAVERPGGPDGLALIRRLRDLLPILVREAVVEAERDRRQVYIQLSGLPIDDCRAEVRLDPAADGAVVTWPPSFRPRLRCVVLARIHAAGDQRLREAPGAGDAAGLTGPNSRNVRS